MKKSALLEMVGDDRNHPDSLNRGFNVRAWKNMKDPLAIIALASHVVPSGHETQQIATRLETMLPDLAMGQLIFVYKWATIKYRGDLIRACEKHIIATIENIRDETEDVPDWLITFSSIHCVSDYGEQIRYTALAKIDSIAKHVSTQPVLVGSNGSLCW